MTYKYVQEILSTATGTEGSLLIVKTIADTLIDEVAKFLIPRSEATMYFGPGTFGSSIDIDLVTADSLKIEQAAEGAAIQLGETQYTSVNIKPDKYGTQILITKEMMEDGKWNLLEQNVKLAGKRLAENETNLIISQALDNAGNTVSGGAAITIANITTAMQYLEDNDFGPTTLFIGPEVLNDLRNIDTFVEYSKSGNTDMMNKGFTGNIYGLTVIKFSANAAPSTTYSKYAYVIDRSQAYAIAEKRGVTVENFDLPTNDLSGATVTQRIRCRHLRANAIAKITTS